MKQILSFPVYSMRSCIFLIKRYKFFAPRKLYLLLMLHCSFWKMFQVFVLKFMNSNVFSCMSGSLRIFYFKKLRIKLRFMFTQGSSILWKQYNVTRKLNISLLSFISHWTLLYPIEKVFRSYIKYMRSILVFQSVDIRSVWIP